MEIDWYRISVTIDRTQSDEDSAADTPIVSLRVRFVMKGGKVYKNEYAGRP